MDRPVVPLEDLLQNLPYPDLRWGSFLVSGRPGGREGDVRFEYSTPLTLVPQGGCRSPSSVVQ